MTSGHPTGCQGDSAPLRLPGNTPSARTDGLCPANPLGNPPGHTKSVCFVIREPAAVIEVVVHCMLKNRFAGSRIRRVCRQEYWISRFSSAPFSYITGTSLQRRPSHRIFSLHLPSALSRAAAGTGPHSQPVTCAADVSGSLVLSASVAYISGYGPAWAGDAGGPHPDFD